MYRLITLLSALLILGPGASWAALLDLGTVTRDTGQGLDWLDVTESVNFSYNQIAADAGGLLSDGWRYANQAEVCSLFVELGMTPPCPSPTPSTPTFVFDITLADGIAALLGNTSGGAFSRVDAIYDDGNSGDGQTGLAQMLEFSSGAQFFVRDDQHSASSISAFVGSFLVRPIPEPGTASLLGCGLVMMSRRRRS